MAYIGHRCSCGHPAIQHQLDDAGRAHCRGKYGRGCGRGCRSSKKSALMPTFDYRGRRVERIVRPGERACGPGGYDTCDCDNCRALYEQLTVA